MGLLDDALSFIDSRKRFVGNTVSDIAADPMQGLGLLGRRALDSIAEGARNQLNAADKMGSVMPSEQRAGLDQMLPGLLGMAPVGMTATYRGPHRPVTVEGGASRMHDLTPAFGEHIYTKNAQQYFGTGDNSLDRQTLSIISKLRGKPSEMVSVYRAVPIDAKAGKFEPGDWVTVNKAYAKQHGESALEGKYKIVEQKVPASHLTTNADSFHEQGYYPE